MKQIGMPLNTGHVGVQVPEHTEVLRMTGGKSVADPAAEIKAALESPIGTPSCLEVVKKKIRDCPHSDPTAVIVVSDNTRPVPYKGESGILWPLVQLLLKEGVRAEHMKVLVATGTHRALRDDEVKSMFDPRVLEAGCQVINHDCKDESQLTYLGTTARNTEVYIDRHYVEADIKILTGLVESHFMAGASGGRKAICPGLIGEDSTFVFHGPEMLSNPSAADLVLKGNPCHEEALEVAQKAGADFILNVTLNGSFDITGVFAGELEQAHEAAVAQVVKQVGVEVEKPYDIVIVHAGFVGLNHYQAAKAGSAASRAVKPGGHVILAAENTDTHPVGALTYRTSLQLLKLFGPKAFMKLIKSEDWTFIPEQWQVQMWAKLFEMIPMDHLYYYSPQFTPEHYEMSPGKDMSPLVEQRDLESINQFVEQALKDIAERTGKDLTELSICYLEDGPYGIPLQIS